MAERTILGLAVLTAYLVLGTALAVAARRMGVKTSRDYYVAGSRLGTFLAAMTYAATTYSAFMIVGLVGFAYSTGVGALGFELVYFVGTMMLLSLLAPKVWRLSKERGWISPSEMLGDLYGSRALGAIVAAIYAFALIPYMGAQVKGIAEAVSGLLGGAEYAYEAGVALGTAILAVWTIAAGMWSVAVTDALQGVWMIIAALGVLAWLLGWVSDAVGFSKATELLAGEGLTGITPFWSFTTFLGFTVPWFFFAVTNPQVVQRLFLPKDERSLAGMIKWFAFFGISYTVLVTLLGLLARSLTAAGVLPFIESRDAVTPTLLSYAPPLLAAIVFTSIAAAAGSTADSIALAVAVSIVTSLYRPLSRRASEAAEIRVGQVVVIGLILAAAAVAMTRSGFIVALSVLSSAILLALAPATIYAWVVSEAARGRGRAAAASVVVGAAIATAAAVKYGTRALVLPVAGLPLPVWTLIASTAVLAVGLAAERGRG
ncbi:MAG: sodium:solute symporter family protein [Thermoproteota archaeon]